jgi:signal peptide peptidase-like protein 2B
MVAYAIGLAMANAAVYIMQMGQPALLYLVPCCLGTMVYIGHKSGELNDLWEGPRVIRAADALLYGAPRVESGAEQEGSEIDGNGDQMQNEEEAELT